MGRYRSGQTGQTVNLLATPSKVRILACPHNCSFADVAQLVEHLHGKEVVSGSNPLIGSKAFVTLGRVWKQTVIPARFARATARRVKTGIQILNNKIPAFAGMTILIEKYVSRQYDQVGMFRLSSHQLFFQKE